MMYLSELNILEGKKRRSKRVGRGTGSGKGGHTVGRGSKGQKARSGNKPWQGFEGGQVPLYKRIPKKAGFSRSYAPLTVTVNLGKFSVFDDGQEVTPISLIEKGIIKASSKKSFDVKILSTGSLDKKLTFNGFSYSAKAVELIEKSGSKISE
jgi:large subunit ribosomal protein L15